MTCADARHLLNGYIDNELSEAETAQVRAHLEGCAACRGEADFLLTLRGLGAESAAAPPPELSASVMERIRAGETTLPEPPHRRTRFRPIYAFAGLAAALLIFFGIRSLPLLGYSSAPKAADAAAAEEKAFYAAGESAAEELPVEEEAPAASAPAEEKEAPAGESDELMGASGANTAPAESENSMTTAEQPAPDPDVMMTAGGREIYADPLLAYGQTKCGFVVAIALTSGSAADYDAGLSPMAVIEDLHYYHATSAELARVLHRLDDAAAAEDIESELYIDRALDEGVIVIYSAEE